MLAECPICGAKTLDPLANQACPKCGSTFDDVSIPAPPSRGVLQLPQRRTPSMRDQIELQKQKARHNFGVEGSVQVFGTWGERLESRPIDIPYYTAPEGRAVIAVVLSRYFMRGQAEIEALRRTRWPFGLHMQAFLGDAYPVLRMNLLIPDDPKSPLWLESALDVGQGDVQDFLEAAVEDDRVDLILAHETHLSEVVRLSFDANGLVQLIRSEVRKVVAAVPPGGGHTEFLHAVTAMERAFPNSWTGIEPANTVHMTFTNR
ncbi:MAG TPA: hypothetical protein VEK57_27545 [Thermoanaerobaculia bacterium]|nr:hypothetical protein [Thermoanaerobaculia bacterium]